MENLNSRTTAKLSKVINRTLTLTIETQALSQKSEMSDDNYLSDDLEDLTPQGSHQKASTQFVLPKAISDKEADEIYQRLVISNSKRKYSTKRNWSDDETKLLNWAIQTYSLKRNI